MPTENQDTPQPGRAEEEARPASYEEILEEYRRRQMIEHLAGPVISIIIHAVIIVACILFLVQPPQREIAEAEVNIKEMKIKELKPKNLEKLKQLEQIPEDAVPTVEKPDVPQETAEVDVNDELNENLAGTDESLDLSSVLDIKPSETRLKFSELYSARTRSGRRRSLRRFGGSVAGESAVLRGLRWLKAHQNPNGSWSRTEPGAMAGLALLAFLAHGETPLSKEFGLTVQKAMNYLVNTMMAVSDDLPKKGHFAYRNGIMTYALAEGYGLTKLPLLKPAMEKGLSFIVRGQQPIGAWNYGYTKTARWDLSVSGWQIQALKSGYVAGADTPGIVDAIEKAVKFLKKICYWNGSFRYSNQAKGTGSFAMQGTGALCLQLLGEGHCTQVRSRIQYIYRHVRSVVWDPTAYGTVGYGGPFYAWYYATQVMFHAGRSRWYLWNKQFTKTLVRHQKPDGHWETPWPPVKGKPHPVWEYDPYYSTALCCLMLEVYYRYLPTYKLPKAIVRTSSILDVKAADLGLEIK